ncbi:hypothetical protein [Thermobrachium celere]|uniref:hypothetical protein n=1 Tax=Thermobrachium celere TaxID=53422 RepID=UPI001A6014B2|nr:hypothetical protein [Thermobrachium celere]GFR34193.1 hypothetical protein TCEA9_00050 [Thermobrachium celere]
MEVDNYENEKIAEVGLTTSLAYAATKSVDIASKLTRKTVETLDQERAKEKIWNNIKRSRKAK